MERREETERNAKTERRHVRRDGMERWDRDNGRRDVMERRAERRNGEKKRR